VLEGGHGPGMPDELVLNRDFRGRVTGLAYYGMQLVLAADDEAALDALAIETRKHRGLRSFVGAQDAVEGLWSRVRAWHPEPSVVRGAQPLYVLAPSALRDVGGDVNVRRAREDDADLVTEHSAQMILGELGYDPRAARAARPPPSFKAFGRLPHNAVTGMPPARSPRSRAGSSRRRPPSRST
jgi:hypothetical protein